jgi:UPF0716 protein FxsA
MTFVGRFFLGVLLLGVAEVYLLIKVARAVSFLGTVGLCVLTAMIGGALVRHQGLRTVRIIQDTISKGEAPTSEIVSGLVLLIAGVLLIVPGFITDSLGFLALIPPLRRRGAAWLARHIEGRLSPGVLPAAAGAVRRSAMRSPSSGRPTRTRERSARLSHS